MTCHPLNAIVAVARNGTIGRNNELPWKLRSDLQRFKRLTMGHTLIMGRKTYDSIGRPLPGRQTIVLSRQSNLSLDEVQVVPSLEEALLLVRPGSTGFVVGGAEVYRLAIPKIQKLYLTRVLADIDGDAHFSSWNEGDFRCVEKEFVPADEFNEWPSEFLCLERK